MLTLIIGLVIFCGLAASMLAYAPTGFNNQPPPATSDSGRGQAVLAADFPVGPRPIRPPWCSSCRPRCGPTRPYWPRPKQGLARSGKFSTVTGALNPDRGRSSPSSLARAHRLLSPFGPADALPPVPPDGVDVSAAVYRAYLASSQFISTDGRTILFETALRAGPPDSTAAAGAVPAVRAAVDAVGRSIGAMASGVSGDAPLASDVGTISGNDLLRSSPS